jgi:hypothetical protein
MQYVSLFKKNLVALSLIGILSCHASEDLEFPASTEPSALELKLENLGNKVEPTLEDQIAAKEVKPTLESTKKETVEIPPFPSKEDVERLHQMHRDNQRLILDKADSVRKLILISENSDIKKEKIKELTRIMALNNIKSTENTAAKNKKLRQSSLNFLFTAVVTGVAVFATGYLVMKAMDEKVAKNNIYDGARTAAVIGIGVGFIDESFRQYINNDFQKNEFTKIRKNSKYLTEQRDSIEQIISFLSPEELERVRTDVAKLTEECKKSYLLIPKNR